jgi:hypothetical protein
MCSKLISKSTAVNVPYVSKRWSNMSLDEMLV